ncbi:MAG: glycerol kinase, partial [Deltaproteobacteria bacterium]|nr:glycerol kinase [Deltaproteobacteria bacterium]
ELVEAMRTDADRPMNQLRVDGGAAANDLLMQLQADLLGVSVARPAMLESTALGAAKLAARAIGLSLQHSNDSTALRVFVPSMSEGTRADHLGRWRAAVAKA